MAPLLSALLLAASAFAEPRFTSSLKRVEGPYALEAGRDSSRVVDPKLDKGAPRLPFGAEVDRLKAR